MDGISSLTESLPDVEFSRKEGIGAALFTLGLVSGGLRLVGKDRTRFGWLFPAGLVTAGLSLLIASVLDRRTERIDEAQDAVRRELDDLDPIARAQVLKEVAQKEFGG